MVSMEVNVDGGLDEVQYSRLIYTLGWEAVQALRRSAVLIFGCNGVGVEVAKNLVLSGIGGVSFVDDGTVIALADLGSNFLLRESDVGHNAASVAARALKELSPCVDVSVVASASLESAIPRFHLIIATSGLLPELISLNRACRSAGIPFVTAQSRGLFSFVFADLGESFTVEDETGGETLPCVLVAGITQEYPATISIVDEQRHGLEDGDRVRFAGIQGMEELHAEPYYCVTVTGTHSFTIMEDTRNFGPYVSGGYFQKVKAPKELSFLPLEHALRRPKFNTSEFLRPSFEHQFHVVNQAIDEFQSLHPRLSSAAIPIQECDVESITARAKQIWSETEFLGNSNSSSSAMQGVTEGTPIEDSHCSNEYQIPSESDRLQALNGGQNHGTRMEEKGDSSLKDCKDRLERKPAVETWQEFGSLNDEVVKVLARGVHVELCPLVAITGGFAAQEVIKAIGKVFSPLHQWLYFDVRECAPAHTADRSDTVAVESRYDHQVALFGMEFQNKLGSLKWLVVGAGGIGCEVLKNLVLMGVGCTPNGSITVTDMDQVSKPNLTDQVLYRVDDLGKQKTLTAGRALRSINPVAQIHCLQEKFDVETESIFDSSFFQSISGVLSAVDTSSARLYIDMRCVTFGKIMIDGGKHGTKGSVQAFVPFQSEMYASTRDPPEFRESPICTLRNFPYSTDHTLQWAVETFDSLFKQRPEYVNEYLSSRDFQESIKRGVPSSRLPILETLRDALVRHRPLRFDECIQWARLQFEELFVNSIKQLCYNFPTGMTTTAGAPFWSGTKRSPTPLEFDPTDPMHLEFIVAASNLQAAVYGLRGCRDHALFMRILQNVDVPFFQPKEGIKIAVSDTELRNSGQLKTTTMTGEDDDAEVACDTIIQDLPTPASLAGYRLSVIEFHKDDERDFHAEFVMTAANLRARNYGIPPSDKQQARVVGGRAVPSIVTATAVIGGLVCLELYKFVQGRPLTDYRHSYFNLALPCFCSAEPVKAVVNKVERLEQPPLLWTLWDKFEMDATGGMSLETFLSDFKRMHSLEITMISYGKSLLYAEFISRKKLQERMPLTLLKLITVVGKVTIPATENKVVLSISCTDAFDNDVEVPDVVVKVR